MHRQAKTRLDETGSAPSRALNRPRGRPRLAPSLRAPQKWRLVSGLILFSFVLLHFINHALGHVSVDAMEAMQSWRRGFWRSPPGTVLLYGAFAIHIALALAKLAGRRSWRIPPWEAVQILLGLAIPILLAAHLAATRGLNTASGFDDTYTTELRLLWPGLAGQQTLLLAVVWVHGCIGLHHWLKTKAWYRPAAPWLLALAALVPTLATTGWIEAARRLAEREWPAPPISQADAELGGRLIETASLTVWLVFGAVALMTVALRLAGLHKRGPAITWPGGRTVRGPRGATLLEISRAAGVPHAAVCGGRGRCSTCRVLVTAGAGTLPEPSTIESAALGRIGAPPHVRLACQIRPSEPLAVRPLIAVRDARPVEAGDAYRWGVERRITVMFTDLRGFTTLAERLYPYDSVFVLNRYFDVMAQIVRRHGGEVDKFLGDGIMALFGVAPAAGAGSRDALFAARDMLDALETLNEEFADSLGHRLRMGIGIHAGPAILGRVGAERSMGLTALGDSVNIASRLEALNKEFGTVVVVSQSALAAAHLAIDGGDVHDVPVRGRAEGLRIIVAHSLEGLREAGEPGAAHPAETASPAPFAPPA